MGMNKKAMVMWAFNVLAATGIIALLFIGFFLVLNTDQVKEVQKIKADITQLDRSGQILTILRTPYDDKTIADDLAKGNSGVFKEKLKLVFGDDIRYKILLDKETFKTTPAPFEITAKLDTKLPIYEGGTKKLYVEVGT